MADSIKTASNYPVKDFLGERVSGIEVIAQRVRFASGDQALVSNGRAPTKTIHLVTDFGIDETGLAKELQKRCLDFEVRLHSLSDLPMIKAKNPDIVIVDTKFSPRDTLEGIEIDLKCEFARSAFAGIFDSGSQSVPRQVAGVIAAPVQTQVPLLLGN